MNSRRMWVALTFLASAWLAFYCPPALAEPALEIGLCSQDREQSGLLCYNKCKPGYHGFLASCHQTCPPGFTDYGAGCSDLHAFAKESYGRGGGEAMSCKPGSWQNGALCYDACKAGYDGVGPVCWQQCPAGSSDTGAFCTKPISIVGWDCWGIFCWPRIDWGWTNAKHSYGRGWGYPLNHCRPGTFQSGALCYPGCKDGFSGAGSVCWQVCPHTHKDDGAFCRRDNGFVKDMYFRDAGVPINYCPEYPRNTHYPIILVHGFGGVDSIRWFGGKDIMHYFHDVIPHMSAGRYGATVYQAQIGSFETTQTRGEQLLAFVDKVLRETGKTRVHLIGHSQGAPTSRYVASIAPEKVASVTSVSGVNHGTALIKLVQQMAEWDQEGDPVERSWLRDLVNFFAPLMNWVAFNDVNKYPIDAGNPYISMSEGGMRIFNWMHPWGLANYTKGQGVDWDSPLGFVSKMEVAVRDEILALNKLPSGRIALRERADRLQKIEREKTQYPVLYYSWGGQQPFSGIGAGGSVIFAILDQFMVDKFGAERGDGAVEKSSQRLGRMLGYYEQDHWLTSNSYTAVVNLSVLWGKAHPISLYCEHANRLLRAEKDYLGLSPSGQAPRFLTVTTDPHGRPLEPVRFVRDGDLKAVQEQPLKNFKVTTERAITWAVPETSKMDGMTPETCAKTCLGNSSCKSFTINPNMGRCKLYQHDSKNLNASYFQKNNHWNYYEKVPLSDLAVLAVSKGPKKSWQWQCLPGIRHPMRINDRGNVEGMSMNGRDLLVQTSADQCEAIAETPPGSGAGKGITKEAYYQLYPDVKNAGMDAFQHFVDYGYREGRRMPGFDPAYYLQSNPDVANSGFRSNPFAHYLRHGAAEGRAPTDQLEQLRPVVCGSAELKQEGHWCNFGKDRLNDWQCRTGHDGSYAPMRKNSQGDVQALSLNGTSVPWSKSPQLCLQTIHERPANLQALSCGTVHKSLFGTTGYEHSNHWCTKNLDLK